MSRTASDVTARAIIDTIDHDAIEHVTYNPDDNESTITFIDGTTLTASEHCWDDEVTEDNVNGYSWFIHNPGDDPRNRYVLSSTHGDDLRTAVIEHADSVTSLPVHTILTTTLVSDYGDSATVSWIPEEITGYDEAKVNVGMREWVWDTVDDAPVFWMFEPSTRTHLLKASVRRFTGTHELVVTARRVYHPNELEPGTFWVHP